MFNHQFSPFMYLREAFCIARDFALTGKVGKAVVTGVLLLSLSFSLSAQNNGPFRQLTTSIDAEVADTVSGMNLDINLISPLAKHGDVTLTILASGGSSTPYVYEIAYTPDPGFVGVDTFVLEYNYFGSYPYLTYRGFKVSVFPSIIKPRQDFAVASNAGSVTIDVLSNDVSSNGALNLTEITAVDHGSAVISGNQVVFTPESGYEGTAHFSYTACNAGGDCQSGAASIGVHGAPIPASDTIEVYTSKNTPLNTPLLYGGYALFQAPANGNLALWGGGESFRYTPNLNFTGVDQFVLSHTTGTLTTFLTVKVVTINTPAQNLMAMSDVVYTPKNQPVTYNVRANDIGNLLVKGWVIPSNLPGTVTNTNGVGNFTFTPNPNFSGVATFQYKLGNSNVPDLEIGTVHVVVGNINPKYSVFELTTPIATPLVIDYEIPLNAFAFQVIDEPNSGVCQFLSGAATYTYNGQTTSGNNLLIYTPNPNFSGTDEFEINYCVTPTGQCQTVKISVNVTPVISTAGPYCMGDECVWAGDANRDGIVNNRDLLTIGYWMGAEGETRNNASLEWYGQFADDWNDPFAEAQKDLKHADTDGNGRVTAEDTLALNLFYGQTHQVIPSIPATDKGLPFIFTFLTPPNPGVGDLVQVQVALGSQALPVNHLTGFTFDVNLSPLIVDSAFQMHFYDDTWINRNAPYLTLAKRPRQGRFEMGFSRANGHAAGGYGIIGSFDFVIIDIIHGGRPEGAFQQEMLTLTFENAALHWADGQTTDLGGYTLSMPLQSRESAADQTRLDDYLIVYPSPADQWLNIHLNGKDTIERLSVTDISGRHVIDNIAVHAGEHAQVDLSSLSPGVYFAVAQTGGGRIVKKFQVVR